MSILVVSVSHKTTTVDNLSRLAMDTDMSSKLATTLIDSEHIDEAVVLSTCNRTEIYAEVGRFHAGLDEITGRLAEVCDFEVGQVRGMCSVYFDEGAVAHIFNVAGGLDSMVVGENQILGQVRSALITCQQAGTVGTALNALFQQGIRVGKRVQNETAIGSAGRSMVTAALRQFENVVGPIAGRRIAIVGAGSMASLAARTVAAAGAQVTALNRTHDKAVRLADAVGGTARPLADLPDALTDADVVITCTGARDLVLTAEMIKEAGGVQAVVDLALPADAEPEIGLQLPLINIDLLLRVGDESLSAGEVDSARELVRQEVADFLARRRAAQVTPTVVALRSMAADVTDAELRRLLSRLPDLGERERAEVAKSLHRVVEKLLHHPTVRVREFAATQGQVDYAAALRELFALDPQAVSAVMTPDPSALPTRPESDEAP